jgi:hypothetical protein
MQAMLDVRVGNDSPITLTEGQSMRAKAAEMSRNRWRPVVGDRVDEMSDAELMDSIDYTLFPNFHPWGAFNRIVYRFRPNGDDHRSSIMEVLLLAPFKGAGALAGGSRELVRGERTRHARQGVRSGPLQHGQRPNRS